jgi:endonuclease/exonuclease/phosphatase family metal-dependent hydrolase
MTDAENPPAFRGRKSRRRLAWLAVALLLGGIIAWGSVRQPAEPAKPMTVEGRAEFAAIAGRRFRVAGFNIRRGQGNDGVHDVLRTAETIRRVKPDIVGLFEVDGRLLGPLHNQAAELSQELGIAAVYAPTERRFWHDDFGNALLSRVRFGRVHCIPLVCTQHRKYRNMLLTRFVVDGREVNFLAAHIDRVKDREHQLRDVFALFHSLKEPAILVGDLNTSGEDPLLRELMDHGNSVNALLDCRADWPAGRVDWILTRGLNVVCSGCVDDGVSDHPLMWADLELPERGEVDRHRSHLKSGRTALIAPSRDGIR